LSKASIHHNGQVLVTADDVKPLNVSEKALEMPFEDVEGCDRNQQLLLLPIEASGNPIHGIQSNNQSRKTPSKVAVASPLSPRRRRAMERESMIEKVRHMVSSPFPYMILILLVIMIVMIFIDIMPIAGKSYHLGNFSFY
jgi:hypothetical protein